MFSPPKAALPLNWGERGGSRDPSGQTYGKDHA
jgi:hypothetical protein